MLNWIRSENIGKMTIFTADNSDDKYKDSVTIMGASSSDFTFYTGSINGNTDAMFIVYNKNQNCSIGFSDWNKNQAFGTITFTGDNKTISLTEAGAVM